ncbi:Asp-tRNA(Asn)/Glu-tRNA(Gln) amidotransferase subunit GatC [Limisphaera sp. 4302-co]|uniref:Asp-tRNA(Asn)/Glu-tRNA(Gln) amidotransferase subunit GatC n=1 Tax=Limisphaera sp. 4302-co TaxID=3400417 RepID=UPI003C208FBC
MSTSPPFPDSGMDVRYVARLARLELTEEEATLFQAQLGQILAYVDQLKQLDVTGIEPTAHAVPRVNVMRPDEPRPGLSQQEALANAPAQANGLFLVPKIVE